MNIISNNRGKISYSSPIFGQDVSLLYFRQGLDCLEYHFNDLGGLVNPYLSYEVLKSSHKTSIILLCSLASYYMKTCVSYCDVATSVLNSTELKFSFSEER